MTFQEWKESMKPFKKSTIVDGHVVKTIFEDEKEQFYFVYEKESDFMSKDERIPKRSEVPEEYTWRLEDIYPTASGKSKQDAVFKEAALLATKELQGGRRGYQALLSHIMNVSNVIAV